MPGQMRMTTPKAIERAPFSPRAHRSFVNCVPAIFPARSMIESIDDLRFVCRRVHCGGTIAIVESVNVLTPCGISAASGRSKRDEHDPRAGVGSGVAAAEEEVRKASGW